MIKYTMSNLRAVLLLIILLSFPSLLFAGEPQVITGDAFIESSGRGLRIATEPNGVRVFIDGVERGLTPFTNNDLPPGDYSIRLAREDYEERSFEITLRNNSRLNVLIEMTRVQGNALISIYKEQGSPESYPFTPQLFTRSSADAPIPLNSDNKTTVRLPAGFHTFNARAFGWEDTSVTAFLSDTENIQVDIYMSPAAFKLENLTQSRKRFNPSNSGNLGITEYRFEVSAPGSGVITIQNNDGTIVYTQQLDPFAAWVQQIQWNGRDTDGNPLPQGTYTVIIEAETLSLRLETEINYSASIFPLSLESGISGLTFAPLPHVLPKGSYQFGAGVLYCSDSGTGSFPFKINMRFSPFDKFELTTFFNINPSLQEQIGWGVSGSAKYNFTDGSNSIPLVFSAGFTYAWANDNGEYPLSPGRGAGFYTPLSLELTNISFVICPAAFWRGPDGLVPELLLSAGILYHGSFFTGGISARLEFDFSKDEPFGRFLAGAEFRIFPDPSNLIFTLQGGILIQGSEPRGYGGLAIGLIY